MRRWPRRRSTGRPVPDPTVRDRGQAIDRWRDRAPLGDTSQQEPVLGLPCTELVATHHRHFGDIVAIANPLRSLSGDAAYVNDVPDPVVMS